MLLHALLFASLTAHPPAAHAEAWTCKITADSNNAIVMQEGRFEVVGNQLFVPSSDAVPLGWRMRIVKNAPDKLLAENEVGPGRQWLVIDKRRLSVTTYSFANRWGHNGSCTRDS